MHYSIIIYPVASVTRGGGITTAQAFSSTLSFLSKYIIIFIELRKTPQRFSEYYNNKYMENLWGVLYKSKGNVS